MYKVSLSFYGVLEWPYLFVAMAVLASQYVFTLAANSVFPTLYDCSATSSGTSAGVAWRFPRGDNGPFPRVPKVHVRVH